LAGCKKIQEALAEPGVLEQFISNKEHATLLRSVFAGLYNLSPDQQASAASVLSLAEITKMVEADGGAGFVLKPQRCAMAV
jgi:glutathione synthase